MPIIKIRNKVTGKVVKINKPDEDRATQRIKGQIKSEVMSKKIASKDKSKKA